MKITDVPMLKHSHVSLVPLSMQHHDDLVAAVKDGELWRLWYTFIPTPEEMLSEIQNRLHDSSKIPFAVIDHQSGKAVGMTMYMNIDQSNRRLEIGGTWYRQSLQRTTLNTICKLLLLTHAFETMNYIAVEFRTHFLNDPSRQAIERLGAKLDGILRNHMISKNGTSRDTCVYSIIANEWPTIKNHLTYNLQSDR